jgi:hypothetical protein
MFHDYPDIFHCESPRGRLRCATRQAREAAVAAGSAADKLGGAATEPWGLGMGFI